MSLMTILNPEDKISFVFILFDVDCRAEGIIIATKLCTKDIAGFSSTHVLEMNQVLFIYVYMS